jgi:hypothetical protein
MHCITRRADRGQNRSLTRTINEETAADYSSAEGVVACMPC